VNFKPSLQTHSLLIFRRAQEAATSENAASWEISRTRAFSVLGEQFSQFSADSRLDLRLISKRNQRELYHDSDE
jgi:hypothetical protein